MENVWVLASLWVGLALIATLLAIWFSFQLHLSEIVVGTMAQLVVGAFVIPGGLGSKTGWISFLAGTGAIVLTFLAGAELDPVIFRMKWKEATVVGLVGFFGPFLARRLRTSFCTGLHVQVGLALSTTSVAVVYAVMLELGFNTTEFGKAILAACFINDLGTVIALRLDSSRSRAGLAPALFFRCRVSTSKKNGLKDHLARYRQIKVSVIGRKSQQTISISDLGRTNDEQGVLLNYFFCIVFIQPVLSMIEPCACATT